MQTRCTVVSGSFVLALLLALPCTVCGAAAGKITAAVPQERSTPGARGCTRASLAVLDDIVGSVSGDPFLPNPSIGGGGGADASGCGKPNRTRKQDPGNPVTAVGRPQSPLTILGIIP